MVEFTKWNLQLLRACLNENSRIVYVELKFPVDFLIVTANNLHLHDLSITTRRPKFCTSISGAVRKSFQTSSETASVPSRKWTSTIPYSHQNDEEPRATNLPTPPETLHENLQIRAMAIIALQAMPFH